MSFLEEIWSNFPKNGVQHPDPLVKCWISLPRKIIKVLRNYSLKKFLQYESTSQIVLLKNDLIAPNQVLKTLALASSKWYN